MVTTPGGATRDLLQELALLDPGRVRFHLDAFEDLYLTAASGDPVGPLALQCAFPVTCADEFIALKDGDGREVGVIRRLADLDGDSRAAVEAQLAWAYLTATITAIRGIDVRFHVPRWDVVTDRGPRVFELHSSRTDVRVLPGGRVLVRDADGNRYEIPDHRRLDEASRAALEDHI